MRLTWTVIAETAIVVTLYRRGGPLQRRFADELETTLREKYLVSAVARMAEQLRWNEDGNAADTGAVLDLLARTLHLQESHLGFSPRLTSTREVTGADQWITQFFLIGFPGPGRRAAEVNTDDDLRAFVEGALGPQRCET